MENQEVNEDADNVEELKAQAEEAEIEEGAENEASQEESMQAPKINFEEKYFYLAAEMQNLEKRFEREKSGILKYGNENILRDLVDVVDNFERTLGFLRMDQDEKIKNIVFGIDMVHKQFLDVLSKNGMTPIKALGETFDPHFHEAIENQTKDGAKEDEIIEEKQTGYILNDRVVRATKVIVNKTNL